MDYLLAQIIPHLKPDEENPGMYSRGSFTEAEESEIVHRLEAWQADIARFLGRPVELRIFVNSFRDPKDNEVKRKGIYVQFNDHEAYHELVYGHPVSNQAWHKPPGFAEKFRQWQDDLRDAIDNYKRSGGDRKRADYYSRQVNERDWVPDHLMIEGKDYGLMYFVAKYYQDVLDEWSIELAQCLAEGRAWTATNEQLALHGVPERFSDWLRDHYETYAHRRVGEWARSVARQVWDSGLPRHDVHELLEEFVAEGTVPPVLMLAGLDYGFAYHMFSELRDELPALYAALRVDDVVQGSMVSADEDETRVEYLDSLPVAHLAKLGMPWALVNELEHNIDELNLRPNQDREMVERLFDLSDLGYRATEAQPYDNFEQLVGKDTRVLVSVNPSPLWTTERVRQLMEEFATQVDYRIEWHVARVRDHHQPVLIVRFKHERLARLVYLLNKVIKRVPPRRFQSFIVSMNLDTHPNPILPREQWLYFSFLSTNRPLNLLPWREVQQLADRYQIDGGDPGGESLVRRLTAAMAAGPAPAPSSAEQPDRFSALASSHEHERGGRGGGGGGRGRHGRTGGQRAGGGRGGGEDHGWFAARRR